MKIYHTGVKFLQKMRELIFTSLLISIYFFNWKQLLLSNSYYWKTMIHKPIYHDLWGFPVNWTNLSDGWTPTKRKDLIKMTNQIITQSDAVENYTETGYIKMKIPTQLYQDILKQRQIQTMKFRECDHNRAAENCIDIRNNVRYFY